MAGADEKTFPVERPAVILRTGADLAAGLRPLLEQGFMVPVEGGRTVQDVLCRQLGVPDKYLRDRVQTVFLNGKAVDDETSAIVHDGDRLALSASMPGLVGATMRKGGFFSGLRAGISHRQRAEATAADSDAVITIKLFNMIALEIGPVFLKKGILVKGEQLASVWAAWKDDVWTDVDTAEIDGRPYPPVDLKSRIRPEGRIRLQILPA